MLNRERIYANPSTDSRKLRGNTWFWCDKAVTRFFRKNFDRKHYSNLRAIYLALCEMDSDFQEGTPIRGFKRTLCTYSGKSMETVTRYFLFLEELEMVTVEQYRDESGYFGSTFLYMAEFDNQPDEYFADPEWFDHILNCEKLELGKGYNIIKHTNSQSRLTRFPVIRKDRERDNPVHKKNYDSNEKSVSNDLFVSTDENAEIHEVSESSETKVVKKGTQELTKKQLCFKQRADRLATIIQSHIKINKNAKVSQWYKEIEKLYNVDGVELKRIDTVLDWFEKNISDQYTPVAHSASTFREKFSRLELAVARTTTSKVEDQSKRWGVKKDVAKDPKMPYKKGVIRRSESLAYQSDDDPNVMIDLSYDQAIDILKTNQPLPKYAADFITQIGIQEGIIS